jgi:predicted ATP-grasp superfamily ATP-dependent carboligase
LPERGSSVLIAGASGRALVDLASRAGYEPLVADFFGDLDTCEAASDHRLVEDGLEVGFRAETLLPALEALADRKKPIGFVYGTGFEDRTFLLDAIGANWRILGNPPEVVRRVKDPTSLAGICGGLAIPHPQILLSRPTDPENWLAKSVGGSGGTHIVPAHESLCADDDVYFQKIAPGDPVSVLFLGDGVESRMIGTSRQWAAPTKDEPFRYGGCRRPAELSEDQLERLEETARALTRTCGLRGLNSIDLLLDADTFLLIEINPRPGATLDLFDDDEGSLFVAHVEACSGRLPRERFDFGGAKAAAIAYVRHEISSMPEFDWPQWTADRQRPRTHLSADAPLCTIKAIAEDPAGARALVDARRRRLLDTIDTSKEGVSA